GTGTGPPATPVRAAPCPSPPRPAATSVDVPPTSKVRTSEPPATSAAPTTPAAGPESTHDAGRAAADSTSQTPPEDCITSGRGSISSRYAESPGARYAFATVVEQRSYSRNSGSSSDDSVTGTSGSAVRS